jgi:hypothetical protein
VRFGDDVAILAAPHAGYVVLRAQGHGALAFYDSSGRLTHVAGARGRGPGELLTVSGAAIGPGDTLFIGDGDVRRISVFSPVDHRFVRSEATTMNDAHFGGTPQGRLLSPMVTWDRERGRTVHSMQRVPWDGSPPVPIAPSVPFERFGVAAVDQQGLFWIADRRTYTLTLYNGDAAVRTVERRPDWFPGDTSPATQPAWVGKGRPFITDVQVGDDGLLWVLIKRKNPRWGDTTAPKTKFISPMGLPPLAEIFEGVLEAIDPVSGALLDSRVVPGDMIGFIAPGRLYQRTDADSSGALMLQVWTVRLKPPS